MNWYTKAQKTAGSENRFNGGVEGLLKNLCSTLGGRPERIEREFGILGFKTTRSQDGLSLIIDVKGKIYIIENLHSPTVRLQL